MKLWVIHRKGTAYQIYNLSGVSQSLNYDDKVAIFAFHAYIQKKFALQDIKSFFGESAQDYEAIPLQYVPIRKPVSKHDCGSSD